MSNASEEEVGRMARVPIFKWMVIVMGLLTAVLGIVMAICAIVGIFDNNLLNLLIFFEGIGMIVVVLHVIVFFVWP